VQIFDVGVAPEKPQQLVDDRLERQLLGRQHRKTRPQIEAHLVTEYRNRPRAGAVRFFDTVGQNAFEQVVILDHGRFASGSDGRWLDGRV
jgi:hypothetical protein